MKNKKTTIILVILTVLVVAGAAVLYNAFSDKVAQDLNTPIAGTQNANTAPDFTVYDADGNAHKLSDYKGKPVVVNFWASWCGPCKIELPAFQDKWEEYGDQVEFLMVNLVDNASETLTSAQNFLATTDYTFPVYFDTEQSAAYTYSIYSIPTTIFVDVDGNLVNTAKGMLSHTTLDQYIQQLL
ncbi:MAG: redoxin domain-containing protein [Ruminococcaceae bacterium]|nr:redoxin domain-containing protein [Oscillospiraceae bacterium]